MSYGLHYILRYETERYGSDFRVLIHEKDYTGPSIKKKIGAGHVKMTKELEGKISGSKLEFSIQSDTDLEYENFFKKDNKSFKVELEFNGGVNFTSYIVNDQYSEPFIAPPYDVEVLCTCGLGLLKTENFGLTGMVSRFTALRYCIDKIGTAIPYAININIWEQSMNPSGHNMLDQLYFNAEIFSDKNCYEVIQALLPENCRINQANGYWMIERPNDRTLDRYIFNADGTPSNETYDWHTYLRHLGTVEQAEADHGRLYPIGNLTLDFLPAYKQITVKQKFGKRESFFRNYNFVNGTLDWSPTTSGFFSAQTVNERCFALLTGNQSDLVNCIAQTQKVITSTPVYFKISYTPVGVMATEYDAGSEFTLLKQLELDVHFQLMLSGVSGKTYYLDQKGWSQTQKNIEIKSVQSSFSKNTLNFQEFNITAAALPETGNVTVKIFQYKGFLNNGTFNGGRIRTQYIGLAVESIKFYTDDLAALSDAEETKIILAENATESDKTIELMPVDLPPFENASLFFDNGNFLLIDGKYIPAKKWGATNARYLEYIAAYLKYLYGSPRAVLTGEVSGWLELNSYIIHDLTGKIYMINTGTWNVIEHTFNLELIELPDGEFSLDEYLPTNIPEQFDPLWNLLNGPITEGASDVFYRNADNRLINKFGDFALIEPDHITFPELDHDIFDRSNPALWSDLTIVDSDPRKWPVSQLKKATIADSGTATAQARLFWNDYISSHSDILPILNYTTDQANIDEIEAWLSENQPLIGNHIKTIDGSFEVPLPKTSTPVIVARKQTIDPYKLDYDSGTPQFSIKDAVVETNVADVANDIKINAGQIISHHYAALDRTSIGFIKQAEEEYNPTRSWDIAETDITLPDNDGYFLYVKVPLAEE